jgi:glycerol-3-phosphate acyltransferase PlsY
MLHAILLIAILAYLLGSVPTGYLLIRLFLHQDIRSFGSGNIGATNVLRSGGKKLGAITFALDVLKGASSVLIASALAGWLVPAALPHRDAQALAALFAVLGHVYPVWLRFRGGKGVATAFGVFLVAAPWAALASIAVFIAVFAISRYVSLASILSAACFPLFAYFLSRGDRPVFFIVVQAAVALLILFKHHQNISRLIAGTESRFGSKRKLS